MEKKLIQNAQGQEIHQGEQQDQQKRKEGKIL